MNKQPDIDGQQTLVKNNTSFKGDVFRLVGGTIIAEIIGVITVPIISRLFGPDVFGTVALFVSVTGLLTVIACWRYELAIVIPEKDEEAAALFFLNLIATLVTTVITILITVFYADSIFIILKYESLIPYKWFIPVFVLFQGFYKTFNYWNSRTKRFDGIALAGVLNSSSTRIINLISGLSGNTSNTAMIGAYTAGQVVATSTIGLQILNKDSGYLKSNFKINKILEVLKRYKKFPLIDIWSALLNTLSINLPSFILTYYFNSTIVGFFSFGHRVLTFPISLIGNSISQVYFQRSAEAKHDGTLAELTENLFKLLCEISISPMFIFMMIAPDLFSLAFGLKWYDAGIYARILAPWTLGVFICSPLSSVVSTLEKQEIGLFMNILLLGTRAVSLIIGGIYQDIYLALICFSACGALIFTGFNLYSITLTGLKIRKILKIILNNILKAFAFIIPLIISKTFNNLHIELTLATLLLLVYYVYLYKTNAKFKNLIMIKLKNV